MEAKMLFGVGLVFETPEFGTIVMGPMKSWMKTSVKNQRDDR